MEGDLQARGDLPERIGSFRITGRLGAGGMGEVYRAVQDRPRREVALKVLHPGRLTPEFARRFAVESEVLGRLRHPGIAQVYEAGTYGEGTAARPFFAMELVDGVPLGDYAHREGLGARARLELVERVARAVEHAHQKGVIHRDLKPDNVLVDAEGRPKVLDFGVARVTDDDLLVATLHTNVGQIVGTLPYMSPEQASADPAAIDTRSDVYALGVVAYELLVGRLPYAVRGKPVTEALRVIRETEPTPLGRVDAALRGDVETIVRKALEKDKERRYPSAAALADDVRRFLEDRPIEAHPPSGWYQLVKFGRRHKALVGSLAAVFVALAAGVVGTSVYAARESAARAEAEAAREDATDVLAYFVETFGRAQPDDLGTEARVRDVLDAEAGAVGERFGTRPAVEAELRRTFGELYAGMTVWPEAEAHLRRSLELFEERLGPDDPRTLDVEYSLAHLLLRAGRLEEARERFTALHERLAARRPEPTAEVLAVDLRLAAVAQRYGESAEAAEAYRAVLEHLAALRSAPESDAVRAAESLRGLELDARDGLGVALGRLGADEEAERELRAALALAAPGSAAEQGVRHNLAVLLMDAGRPVEAEELLRASLAVRTRAQSRRHVETASTMRELAAVYVRQGMLDEAERLVLDALATLVELEGESSPSTIATRITAGRVLRQRARFAESAELLETALSGAGDRVELRTLALNELAITRLEGGQPAEARAMFEELLAEAEDDSDRVVLLLSLGQALARMNEVEPAVERLEEAVALAREVWPGDHPKKAAALHRLAQVRRGLDEYEAAAELHAEALAIRRATLPADHQDLSSSLNDMGFVHLDRGDVEGALPYFEEALAMDRRTLGEEAAGTLISMSNLANLYLRIGRFQDAEDLLAPTMERVPRTFPAGHKFPGVNLLRRGQALLALERWADAAEVLREAVDVLAATYGPDHGRTLAARDLLEQAEARR